MYSPLEIIAWKQEINIIQCMFNYVKGPIDLKGMLKTKGHHVLLSENHS